MKKFKWSKRNMESVVESVQSFFDKNPKSKNIGIGLQPVGEKERAYFRQFFDVDDPPQLLGYVHFTKKVKK